jgi:aspartate kinase
MIVYNYLKTIGIYADWLDARKVIKTDELHREGNVDWELTETLIRQKLDTLSDPDVVVTQGFIGSSHPGETVTLGREGSDYSAAIFAYSLQATAVTIWKDVPGILNGDPKFIENTHKYSELSYQEAAEMSYYGAKVIHPKTIRPLAIRNIPLYVRSFQQPEEDGTVIHIHKASYLPPAIVIKENQSLISFTMKDFSFISEKKLSLIFHMLDLLNIKINMMQVSALSFSICSDFNHEKLEGLLSGLKDEFQIRYNTSLKLITLLKYDQQTIDQFTKGREILMEQKTRSNFQVVLR